MLGRVAYEGMFFQADSATRPDEIRITSGPGAPGVSIATTPPSTTWIVPPGSPVTRSAPEKPSAAHSRRA